MHKPPAIDWTSPEFAHETIMAHPAFPNAVRATAAGALQHFRDNLDMRLYAKDRLAFFIASLAFYFFCAGIPFTAGSLKKAVLATNMGGERRVVSLIATMRRRGDLVIAEDNTDKRAPKLSVGKHLFGFCKTRLGLEFHSLALLFPVGQQGLDRFEDDKFFCAVQTYVGAKLFDSRWVSPGLDFAILNFFGQRDLGTLLLYEIVSIDEGAIQAKPVTLSVSAVAKSLTVSRAHVRNILQDADQAGLLRWDDERREVTLSEPLIIGLQRLTAVIFLVIGEAILHVSGKDVA